MRGYIITGMEGGHSHCLVPVWRGRGVVIRRGDRAGSSPCAADTTERERERESKGR